MDNRKKTRLLIINRSFWPDSLVQGQALLRLAERAVLEYHVTVATQVKSKNMGLLADKKRTEGIIFRILPAYSTSQTHISLRMLENIFFMIWVVGCLIISRPNKIYVTTNPPILVPFVANLYAKLRKVDLYYHLQDIHPEVMGSSISINKYLFRALQLADSFTMRGARGIITITDAMMKSIRERSNTNSLIHLLDNPAYQGEVALEQARTGDFVYCGNLGRFQRIPLLVNAIHQYIRNGGNLQFTFIGDGIHRSIVAALAHQYANVHYLGALPANEASLHISKHRWGLLPIEDQVMLYAFPSKSSAYVLAKCSIFAICGADTSISEWVRDNHLGIVAEPEVEKIVQQFRYIEAKHVSASLENIDLASRLTIEYYVSKLLRLIET